MRTRLVEEHRLENDLRGALERREFVIYYQPIVGLVDGVIEGFEALVRWEHPARGLLYPDTFVPLAEQTGLIVPIGWMVLEGACRQLSAWQELPTESPFVSVNFSGLQFMQPDVVRQVERIVNETGCSPGQLRLELTETMIMESAVSAEKLSQLSDLGIQLYIDDFGTGVFVSQLFAPPSDARHQDRPFVHSPGHPSAGDRWHDSQPGPHAQHGSGGRRHRDRRPVAPPPRAWLRVGSGVLLLPSGTPGRGQRPRRNSPRSLISGRGNGQRFGGVLHPEHNVEWREPFDTRKRESGL